MALKNFRPLSRLTFSWRRTLCEIRHTFLTLQTPFHPVLSISLIAMGTLFFWFDFFALSLQNGFFMLPVLLIWYLVDVSAMCLIFWSLNMLIGPLVTALLYQALRRTTFLTRLKAAILSRR